MLKPYGTLYCMAKWHSQALAPGPIRSVQKSCISVKTPEFSLRPVECRSRVVAPPPLLLGTAVRGLAFTLYAPQGPGCRDLDVRGRARTTTPRSAGAESRSVGAQTRRFSASRARPILRRRSRFQVQPSLCRQPCPGSGRPGRRRYPISSAPRRPASHAPDMAPVPCSCREIGEGRGLFVDDRSNGLHVPHRPHTSPCHVACHWLYTSWSSHLASESCTSDGSRK
jgi:hypothetical protein